MAAPSRMPQYYISNDGMGPYARFICERDSREYRSQPSIAQTVKENVVEDVKGGIFGGLMRNVPIVGDSIANRV